MFFRFKELELRCGFFGDGEVEKDVVLCHFVGDMDRFIYDYLLLYLLVNKKRMDRCLSRAQHFDELFGIVLLNMVLQLFTLRFSIFNKNEQLEYSLISLHIHHLV